MRLKFKLHNLFLLIFCFSFIVCIDVKWHRLFTDTIPPLKYSPDELSLIALLFYFRPKIFRKWFTWIALILFLEEFGGSLYSILVLKKSFMDSFLGRSLNMLVLFSSLSFFMTATFETIENFLRKYKKIVFILLPIYIGLTIIYVLAGRPEFLKNGKSIARQLYHEELYFLIPSWVIFYIDNYRLWAFFSWILGFLSLKLTGFALSLANFYFYMKDFGIKKFKSYSRLIITYSVIMLLIILGFGAINLYCWYFHIKSPIDIISLQMQGLVKPNASLLPTGNLGIRFFTYSLRIKEFLKSPIFGSFFVGNPNIKISKNLYIPSHSDILDILSFSGIFGICLFLLLNLLALYKWEYVFQILKNNTNTFFAIFFYYSIIIIVSFIITCAFNPIILSPTISSFYWFWLGFNLAIRERFTQKVYLKT